MPYAPMTSRVTTSGISRRIPAPCRRKRHSQALGNTRVTGVVGEFTHAMVVRAAAGGFRHEGRMDGGQRRRKVGRRPRRPEPPKGQRFCACCICTHEAPGCPDPQLDKSFAIDRGRLLVNDLVEFESY